MALVPHKIRKDSTDNKHYDPEHAEPIQNSGPTKIQRKDVTS